MTSTKSSRPIYSKSRILHNIGRVNQPPKDPEDLPGGVFEAPAVFSLAYFLGTYHLRSQDGQKEWFGYDPYVPYPESPYDEAMARLLLEDDRHMFGHGRSGGQRYLRLPENYVPMAQALNDAIGARPHEHSLDVARMLFEELGSSLAKLRDGSHLAPKSIDYRQVIFLRENGGIKLLPPLELIPSTPEAVIEVARSLTASTVEATVTPVQVDSLYRALQSFLISYDVAGARYETT